MSDAVPQFAQRSKRERMDNAGADAGFALTIAIGVWAVVVSLWRLSNAVLIVWASLAMAAVITVYARSLGSHAEAHEGVLQLHRLYVRSIPIKDIREVTEAHRYRRVSTTRLRLASGRVVRTKAATADQVRQLMLPNP